MSTRDVLGVSPFLKVRGHNLALDFRFGAADSRRIHAGAKDLVALGPDVIVTGASPATRAVLELTQTSAIATSLPGLFSSPSSASPITPPWRCNRPIYKIS
jgi:hypothetical protein